MTTYLERIEPQVQMLRMLQATGLSTYSREVSSGCGPIMRVEGQEKINFISNSYMGFSTHPKVVAAAKQALDEYGVGMGGSPLACGTTVLHQKLAEHIAAHYGKEACLIFASGYQALAGCIQGMLGKPDMALLDSLDHRSIVDGCILAGCKVRSFVHNNLDDLAELVQNTAGHKGHRMVIVDSVYSMDGDLAPLPGIQRICRPAQVTILIDEAHSLGVIGRTGKGLLEHFDLPNGADIISGTFSKFAGAVGGFAAADRDVIDYLRHYSSPFVFSASIPPAIVAAVQASFDLLTSEPEWHERLWSNVRFLLDGFKSHGVRYWKIGDARHSDHGSRHRKGPADEPGPAGSRRLRLARHPPRRSTEDGTHPVGRDGHPLSRASGESPGDLPRGGTGVGADSGQRVDPRGNLGYTEKQ